MAEAAAVLSEQEKRGDRKERKKKTAARIRWDEEAIKIHHEERGVKYGTMKIDQPETPFLQYDSDDDPVVRQFVENGAPPRQVDAAILQRELGLLSAASKADDEEIPKWRQVETMNKFEAKRNALYHAEALAVAPAIEIEGDLPEGWTAHESRSTPVEIYYFNRATGESTWSRPS